MVNIEELKKVLQPGVRLNTPAGTVYEVDYLDTSYTTHLNLSLYDRKGHRVGMSVARENIEILEGYKGFIIDGEYPWTIVDRKE